MRCSKGLKERKKNLREIKELRKKERKKEKKKESIKKKERKKKKVKDWVRWWDAEDKRLKTKREKNDEKF